MRPKSIVLFERCAYAGVAFGILSTFLFWGDPALSGQARQILRSTGSSPAFHWSLLQWAIEIITIYFIAHRRSNIGKWIFAVWAFLNGIFFLLAMAYLAEMLFSQGVVGFLSLMRAVLLVFAASLLFRAESRSWLSDKAT